MPLTKRQADALRVLGSGQQWWTPSGFAYKFWPDKTWQRINGPWGLGPDASGLHGGRMLTRLNRMGLVRIRHCDGYWEAAIKASGREALRVFDGEAH